MKTLFAGLYLETVGLIWDFVIHLSGSGEGEGLFEPAHVVIFAGFALSFVGAVLVYRNLHRHTQP